MLVPRYSTRALLGLVTGAALYSLLVARALRGGEVATVAAVALSTLLAGLALYAALFAVIWVLALVLRLRLSDRPARDHAAGRP